MVFHFEMVSWNVRGGLHFTRKQKFLQFLNCKHNLSMLGILETKKDVVDDFIVHDSGLIMILIFLMSHWRGLQLDYA